MAPDKRQRKPRNSSGRGDQLLNWGERFARLSSGYRAASVIAVVLCFAVVVLANYALPILTGQQPIAPSSNVLLILIVSCFVLVLALAGVMMWMVARFLRQRTPELPEGRLHMRLVREFCFIAVVPTVFLAIFAGLTIMIGFDTWFGERTEAIIDRSKTATSAYVREHKQLLTTDIRNIAALLRDLNDADFLNPDTVLAQRLAGYAFWYRMAGVFVTNHKGQVISGSDKNLKSIQLTSHVRRLESGQPIVYTSPNQLAAAMRLPGFTDAYLIVTRDLNPALLGIFGETNQFLEEFERNKRRLQESQLLFSALYLLVAMLILLTAVVFGTSAANRIVQPIGALVAAAERVRTGDLSARVEVPRNTDEIGVLGRAFNRMTGQLQTQRNELIEANRQFDRRRRFTEAVLSGVSAAVIGLDRRGRITLVNRSALSLLGGKREDFVGYDLADIAPELEDLVSSALGSQAHLIQRQVDLAREGDVRHMTVRVTSEAGLDESKGYVVTLDDVTDLVNAQRMSAWADIARRIAHEMKNPLTPIQLSAERLRRKYRDEIVSSPEIFEQCTDTIIRQVNDIGRMVDEFSTFARMPTAVIRTEDPVDLVEQTVFLQRVANPDITFRFDPEGAPRVVKCDARLASQALLNVLKNGCEAVHARLLAQGENTAPGVIVTRIYEDDDGLIIEVTDNGCGLPKEGRSRLTEPYMTTRAKGTGLGLAIVRKIMEDHGGSVTLDDAPEPEDGGPRGASVRLVFPADVVVETEELVEGDGLPEEDRADAQSSDDPSRNEPVQA